MVGATRHSYLPQQSLLPGVHDIRLPLADGHTCAPALGVLNICVSYLCLTFTGCISSTPRVVFIVATDPSIALNRCSYKRLFTCLRLWTVLSSSPSSNPSDSSRVHHRPYGYQQARSVTLACLRLRLIVIQDRLDANPHLGVLRRRCQFHDELHRSSARPRALTHTLLHRARCPATRNLSDRRANHPTTLALRLIVRRPNDVDPPSSASCTAQRVRRPHQLSANGSQSPFPATAEAAPRSTLLHSHPDRHFFIRRVTGAHPLLSAPSTAMLSCESVPARLARATRKSCSRPQTRCPFDRSRSTRLASVAAGHSGTMLIRPSLYVS